MSSRLIKVAVLAIALFALTSAGLFVHYSSSQTPRPWRGFAFVDVPAEIEAFPGQTVTFNAGVINTGWYWLGDFNISLNGMPADYQYSVTPSHFENIMIVRGWNSDIGVFREPQNFSVSLKLPENASGVYLVNMTGQEFRSWYKYSNSTQFLVKVSSLPEFKITNLIFPETIQESKPFNVSFVVKNDGVGAGTLNLKIEAPSDWDVSSRTQSVSLNAKASQTVQIVITPSNKSGTVSILAEYPFMGTVLNITQVGPYLTPTSSEMPNEPTVPTSGFSALVDFFKGVGPIVFAIGVILLIVIAWNVWSIYKGYKNKAEPEEMKSAKKSTSATSTIPEL